MPKRSYLRCRRMRAFILRLESGKFLHMILASRLLRILRLLFIIILVRPRKMRHKYIQQRHVRTYVLMYACLQVAALWLCPWKGRTSTGPREEAFKGANLARDKPLAVNFTLGHWELKNKPWMGILSPLTCWENQPLQSVGLRAREYSIWLTSLHQHPNPPPKGRLPYACTTGYATTSPMGQSQLDYYAQNHLLLPIQTMSGTSVDVVLTQRRQHARMGGLVFGRQNIQGISLPSLFQQVAKSEP